MNPVECRQILDRLLQSQQQRVADTRDYLQQVRQAVAEDDLETLQTLLERPGIALAEIESIEAERQQLLQRFGFGTDAEGFERCLGWCDDADASLASRNQALRQELIELQRQLQLNQLLVNKGQDRVRRSLGILTGMDTATQGKTYDSAGKAALPRGRRDIAIA